MDIKETKEALGGVIALGNATGKSMEDGKISWTDSANYLAAIMQLPGAIAGAGEIPEELKDLDDNEKAALIAYVKTEFDIPNEKVEGIVEEGLALAYQIYLFVNNNFLPKNVKL